MYIIVYFLQKAGFLHENHFLNEIDHFEPTVSPAK